MRNILRQLPVISIIVLCLLAIAGCSQPASIPQATPAASTAPATSSAALRAAETLVPATKLFDNLFYIGNKETGSLLLTTSQGLILIDAMWSESDGKNIIVPGIQKLGFDPKNLKAILLTHGHGDHYGAAPYIKATYGPHIYLTDIDWEYMVTRTDSNSTIPKPDKDMVLKDGEPFVLGDTSIDVVVTPGHTPGGPNFIFPVYDNGVKHICAIVGGLATPRGTFSHQLIWGGIFVQSLKDFKEKAIKAGADVTVGPHFLKTDYCYDAFLKMQTKKPGEPNPLVGTFPRYVDDVIKTVEMNNDYVSKIVDPLTASYGIATKYTK
jgi:metallo-beta-lactamase class B